MLTRHISTGVVLAGLVWLVSCSSAPPKKVDMGPPLTAATSFIQAGQTTREQMLLKLGVPSRQFEAGRILAWRVRTAEEGLVTVSDYPGSPDLRYNAWPATSRGYDLIVVFDPADHVQTHSLVPARR